VGLTDNLSQCGCFQIPLVVELAHNLVRDNIFAKFLARNNYSISRVLDLKYNEPNDSWQSNLHYRGLSADANTEERWDLVFELQCTEDMGGIHIGRRIWKLAVGVYRKNLTTFEDFDTRIIIGLMPEIICDTNANELDFEVSYNTQLDLASVRPDATIYQTTLFDNIGLFKNRSWIDNPDLIFMVSQAGIAEPQTPYDYADHVVFEDEAVPTPSS